MDLNTFFNAEFDEHEAVTRATRGALLDDFIRLCRVAQDALQGGNKLIFFGNGGSAADAQHLAAELVVRYKVNRAPLAAIALTTDSSTLTAGANDFGYETIFERQLRALGRAGDVARAAGDIDMVPTALSGGDGGDLTGLANPLLIVPSKTIARIQEMHITLGQMLCDVLEQTCAR